MPHSDGLLHHLPHHFDGTFEIETLTWAHVQLQGDSIQFFLAVFRQVWGSTPKPQKILSAGNRRFWLAKWAWLSVKTPK